MDYWKVLELREIGRLRKLREEIRMKLFYYLSVTVNQISYLTGRLFISICSLHFMVRRNASKDGIMVIWPNPTQIDS